MVKDKLTTDGVLMLLHDHGIKYIQCNYSGGGDSGAIDEWGFYDSIEGAKLDWESAGFANVHDAEEMNMTDELKAIWKKVEDPINEVLMKADDWWNNEGGYGYFLFDVEKNSYTINNNTYYTKVSSQTVNGKFESAE
jgi:hypothetical protein